MSDMEKTMELGMNPYDRLIEQPVSDVRANRTLAMKKELDVPENEKPSKAQPVKPVEVIPISDKAIFNNMSLRELGILHKITLEIEEDLLVPDTEPDMETVLNTEGHIDSISFQSVDNGGIIKGEASLEIMYRAADEYNDKIIVIPGKVSFKKEWVDSFTENTDIKIWASINKIECRIINERKYRVKIYMNVNAREIINQERKMFEGIRDEQLEFMREKVEVLRVLYSRYRETEVKENLQIDNDKIKPLKIIKSSFLISENHRQLTADRLVINSTIWVRILYIAELASQSGLTSQPMLYTGKIDNTQFLPIKGDQNATSCGIRMDVKDIKATINESFDGFSIEGTVNTEIDFYELVEREIVTDFYNLNDDMACDNKEETVCCGVETKIKEKTIKDSIDFKENVIDLEKIIFTEAYTTDIALVENEIQGKLHMEVLTVAGGNKTSLAKKITEFAIPAENIKENQYASDTKVSVREMTADIVGQNQLSIVVQLQAEMEICTEGRIRVISNPCIIREENSRRDYPIIIYTVKEKDTIWDIAKKYRVSADYIKEVNKIDNVSEGMKIVVAR